MNYFLVIDNSTQWFSYIVASDDQIKDPTTPEKWNAKEYHEMPVGMNSPFLSRIWDRRRNFSNAYFYGMPNLGSCSGWDLSIDDFNKLKELISLFPSVVKFNQLSC